MDFDAEHADEGWAKADPGVPSATPTQKTRQGDHVSLRLMISPPGNQKLYFGGEHIGETWGEGGDLIPAPSVHGSGFIDCWQRDPLRWNFPVVGEGQAAELGHLRIARSASRRIREEDDPGSQRFPVHQVGQPNRVTGIRQGRFATSMAP